MLFGAHELIRTPMNIFTPHIRMALACILFCTTFLACLLNAFALKHVNPSIVSIDIYLQPLIATAVALTFMKMKAGIFIFRVYSLLV